jgi:16S rRNA (guanine527-N7)-methyltransferase
VSREKALEEIAGAAGVPEAAPRLGAYLALLKDWNQRINLVSRRSTEEDLAAHVSESLEGLAYLPAGARRLLDIGSGGGFPALPLLLARRDLDGVLVESTAKKAAFLREACRTLGLTSSVVEARFPASFASDMTPFQVMTTRAVAEPLALGAAARRFLAPGGRVLLYTTRAVLERSGRTRLRYVFHPSPRSEQKGIAVVECST